MIIVGVSILGLLVGHVLADFYLQTNAMAREKSKNGRWLAAHCAAYSVVQLPCSAFCFSEHFLWGWLILSLSHAIVDLAKCVCERHCWNGPKCFRDCEDGSAPVALKRWKSLVLLVLDQAIHVLICVLLVLWLGGFGPAEMAMPLAMIFSLLVAGKPGEVFMRNLLVSVGEGEDGDERDRGFAAGRYIGVAERVLVAALTFYGQFDAIAFVLAAKSIARFKQLDDRDFAERYLVGTLSSVAFALLFTCAARYLALF